MITIEQLPFIPKLDYASYSLSELRFARRMLRDIEKAAGGIWVVQHNSTPIVVVGVQKTALLAPTRLWFLMCSAMEDRVVWHLRALKKAVEELDYRFDGLETLVEKGWGVGIRFANFCGFKETARTVDILGRTFTIMER